MSAKVIAECLQRYSNHMGGQEASRAHAGWERELDRSVKGTIDEMLRDPVRYALRGCIRDAGWQAFHEGGVAAMHDLENDVLVLFPTEERRNWVSAILDKWWNGVGTTSRGPGWMS
jgi:hypothetical protein